MVVRHPVRHRDAHSSQIVDLTTLRVPHAAKRSGAEDAAWLKPAGITLDRVVTTSTEYSTIAATARYPRMPNTSDSGLEANRGLKPTTNL